MVYPYLIYRRGHIKRLPKVHAIIIIVPKNIESNDIIATNSYLYHYTQT